MPGCPQLVGGGIKNGTYSGRRRCKHVLMQRVVLLGRGGAGKSTFARRLSEITGIPAIELDKHFWSDELEPLGSVEWTARQAALVAGERWILDGDVGPYDVLEPRLRQADTVVVLDYSFPRAAWRAGRCGTTAGDHDPTSAMRWPFMLRAQRSIGCPRRDRHDNYSPASAPVANGGYMIMKDDTYGWVPPA